MKKSLQALVSGLLCLTLLEAHAETIMDLLTPGSTVRHAVFPFYRQPDLKLCTIVQVEKAYLDYQRKGFFHIGLLPVAALEGVTIEFRDTRSAAETFQPMQRWLGVGGGRRVELRQVKFLFSTNSLEAGKVECRDGNHWELMDGVRLMAGGHETRAKRAILQISGKDAGQVVLQESPQMTINFLCLPPASEH